MSISSTDNPVQREWILLVNYSYRLACNESSAEPNPWRAR